MEITLECIQKQERANGATVLFMLKPEKVNTDKGPALSSKKTFNLVTDSLDDSAEFKPGSRYTITIKATEQA